MEKLIFLAWSLVLSWMNIGLVNGNFPERSQRKSRSILHIIKDENNPSNPGPCNETFHGKIKLIKSRLGADVLIMCTKKADGYFWKSLTGSSTIGEYFDPASDCSDVVDRVPDPTDGFYWIKLAKSKRVVKVWCDVTTDGGGFMLVAKKNGPVTWTVPSSNETVSPGGNPHWSSTFGDVEMLDIRIKFSTTSRFEDTKADWSFRLSEKRLLGELLVRGKGNCTNQNPGIGHVDYVKDLQIGKVVNNNFRCSLFGGHSSTYVGWGRMNYCLRNPCSRGFSFLPGVPGKLDDFGSFSYSAYNNATSSGVIHRSTAFVGCSDGKCCACYGPKGGTKNYCTTKCTSFNGGKITKRAHVWIWIRSTLPKRVWKKCIEYSLKDSNGKTQKFKVNYETSVVEKGGCAKAGEIKHNGAVLVVPSKDAIKKIPPVPGLLLYRPENQELFVQGKGKWNMIAMEKQVKSELQLVNNTQQQIKGQLQQIKSEQHQIKTEQLTLKKQIQALNSTNNRWGCRKLKFARPGLSNGYYKIQNFKAYCDMSNNGWTLVARFSNRDSKNWISSSHFWYDSSSAYGSPTSPSKNSDMISEAFWHVRGSEIKITRSDDSSHTALLQTTSNCLGGATFRSKITSYGNYRNRAVWANNQCRGSCRVSYGGQYQSTAGFEMYNCNGNIQSSKYIGFWCDWDNGDGAVLMIGGGGNGCYRADHGIGITEENEAKFGAGNGYDFGSEGHGNMPSSYSLNLWVR